MLATTTGLSPRFEWAAGLIVVASLIVILRFHLLAALFAGLLVFEMVIILVPFFHLERLAGRRAKLVAVGILAATVFGLLTTAVIWGVTFLRGGVQNLPLVLQMVAEVIEGSRNLLPAALVAHLPTDGDQLKIAWAQWLRDHTREIQIAGQETVRTLAHILIGMVVGALLSLREVLSRDSMPRPLALALDLRIDRFCTAFRRVVFAQIRISGLNTLLTYLYLGIALPLLGIQLPYVKTLLAVTFLAGLLPVIGNLISNTMIVLVSLHLSWQIAAGSLAFLVIIHKLEYFLNAYILGNRIKAAAWELLLAMLVMEALFGVRGLIAAPVYYAYLKDELTAQGWI